MTLADTPTISLTVVPYRLVILASEPETIVTCIYRLMHKPPSLSADSSLPNDSIIPLDSAATVATSGCCSGDNSQTSHGVLSTFIEEKSWTSVPSGGWPGLRILRISASWLPCLEICAGLLGPSDRMASTTSQQSASGTSGVGHRCLTGQQSHRQLHNCQQKYHNPRQQQYQQFHQSHSRSQQQLQQAQQSGSSYLRFQDLDSTDYHLDTSGLTNRALIETLQLAYDCAPLTACLVLLARSMDDRLASSTLPGCGGGSTQAHTSLDTVHYLIALRRRLAWLRAALDQFNLLISTSFCVVNTVSAFSTQEFEVGITMEPTAGAGLAGSAPPGPYVGQHSSSQIQKRQMHQLHRHPLNSSIWHRLPPSVSIGSKIQGSLHGTSQSALLSPELRQSNCFATDSFLRATAWIRPAIRHELLFNELLESILLGDHMRLIALPALSTGLSASADSEISSFFPSFSRFASSAAIPTTSDISEPTGNVSAATISTSAKNVNISGQLNISGSIGEQASGGFNSDKDERLFLKNGSSPCTTSMLAPSSGLTINHSERFGTSKGDRDDRPTSLKRSISDVDTQLGPHLGITSTTTSVPIADKLSGSGETDSVLSETLLHGNSSTSSRSSTHSRPLFNQLSSPNLLQRARACLALVARLPSQTSQSVHKGRNLGSDRNKIDGNDNVEGIADVEDSRRESNEASMEVRDEKSVLAETEGEDDEDISDNEVAIGLSEELVVLAVCYVLLFRDFGFLHFLHQSSSLSQPSAISDDIAFSGPLLLALCLLRLHSEVVSAYTGAPSQQQLCSQDSTDAGDSVEDRRDRLRYSRLQTIRDRPSDEPSCDHGLLMSARALWQVVVLGCLIPELTVGRKFVDASGRKQQQQNKPQLKQSYLPGLASSLSSQAMYTPEAAGNSTKG